jgi:hypothetical protein
MKIELSLAGLIVFTLSSFFAPTQPDKNIVYVDGNSE